MNGDNPASPQGKQDAPGQGAKAPRPGQVLPNAGGAGLKVPHTAHAVRRVDHSGEMTGMIPVVGKAKAESVAGPTLPGVKPVVVRGTSPIVPEKPEVPVADKPKSTPVSQLETPRVPIPPSTTGMIPKVAPTKAAGSQGAMAVNSPKARPTQATPGANVPKSSLNPQGSGKPLSAAKSQNVPTTRPDGTTKQGGVASPGSATRPPTSEVTAKPQGAAKSAGTAKPQGAAKPQVSPLSRPSVTSQTSTSSRGLTSSQPHPGATAKTSPSEKPYLTAQSSLGVKPPVKPTATPQPLRTGQPLVNRETAQPKPPISGSSRPQPILRPQTGLRPQPSLQPQANEMRTSTSGDPKITPPRGSQTSAPSQSDSRLKPPRDPWKPGVPGVSVPGYPSVRPTVSDSEGGNPQTSVRLPGSGGAGSAGNGGASPVDKIHVAPNNFHNQPLPASVNNPSGIRITPPQTRTPLSSQPKKSLDEADKPQLRTPQQSQPGARALPGSPAQSGWGVPAGAMAVPVAPGQNQQHSELPGGSEYPGMAGMARMPGMPPGMAGMPRTPGYSGMPGRPPLPGMPGMPGMPGHPPMPYGWGRPGPYGMPMRYPMRSPFEMQQPRSSVRESLEAMEARQIQELRQAEEASHQAEIEAIRSRAERSGEELSYEELEDIDWDEFEETFTERLIRKSGRWGETILMVGQAARWALVVLVTVAVVMALVFALDRSATLETARGTQSVVSAEAGPDAGTVPFHDPESPLNGKTGVV